MPLPSSSSILDWAKPRLFHIFAPVVALGAVWVFVHTTLAEKLEYLTVDLRFLARAPFDPPADDRIFVIGIDQQSLDAWGRWPWPRTREADFLHALAISNLNPHTIAFDLLLTESSPDDAAFADAAGLLPSVVTGAFSDASFFEQAKEDDAEKSVLTELTRQTLTHPYTHVHGDVMRLNGSNVASLPAPPIRQQSLFGFVNSPPSIIDGLRHRIPLVMRIRDQVYPSLALQSICQLLDVDADKVTVDVGNAVTLTNSSKRSWVIPINDSGEVTINYRNPSGFRSESLISLSQGLAKFYTEPDKYPIPKKGSVTNSLLLIGTTAEGTGDMGATPFESASPLVFTHANVINNVLSNDYLRLVPDVWIVLGWCLLTWGMLFGLREAPIISAVLTPILTVVAYVIVGFVIFGAWSWQIALTWPVLSFTAVNFGGVVLRWRQEQKGRQEIKMVFSRMLSPEVMNHLLDHPDNLKLGGSERRATVLFSDIRGYTQFSEGLLPDEVVRQLNMYFERMVACVIENRGTLHKFIGDAVMAAWGDLEDSSLGPKEDAQNAVRAALEMRRRLRTLNEERHVAHLIPIRIGIGLNHGEVLAGLIGASNRSEFTVMGDAVNTASRLEGMTKEFHTDLAISESVSVLLEEKFLLRRLGLIQLLGKQQATVVYEVVCEKTHVSDSQMDQETVTRYEQAFDFFLARRFPEAETAFAECQLKYPQDYCIDRYLQACRDFQTAPPDAVWDGRIVMNKK